MGDNYFLLTNLLSEDEQKIITSIAAHLERGEKRVGIQQVATETFCPRPASSKCASGWALRGTASCIIISAVS